MSCPQRRNSTDGVISFSQKRLRAGFLLGSCHAQLSLLGEPDPKHLYKWGTESSLRNTWLPKFKSVLIVSVSGSRGMSPAPATAGSFSLPPCPSCGPPAVTAQSQPCPLRSDVRPPYVGISPSIRRAVGALVHHCHMKFDSLNDFCMHPTKSQMLIIRSQLTICL